MRIFLQERDYHIFQELALCRFLTLRQIAQICFAGREEAAKKRLQKLGRGRFIARHSPGILAQNVYLLSRLGCEALSNADRQTVFRVCKPPATTTLQHELSLRDCRASLIATCAKDGASLTEFSLDSNALAFLHPGGVARPDGYFSIQSEARLARFYLEFDNGTEPLGKLVERVLAYRHFYNSGAFAVHCGADDVDYRDYPFRILFIFSSSPRLSSFLSKMPVTGTRGFVVAKTYDGLADLLSEVQASGTHKKPGGG